MSIKFSLPTMIFVGFFLLLMPAVQSSADEFYKGKTIRFVVGLAAGGGDWTDWHFRDVTSGKDLSDIIRWTKYSAPVFAADGKGIYYSGFPAPKAGEELLARDLGNAVHYHRFGTPQSADRKIYDRPDHPDWQFDPHLTPGSHWLVLTCGEGQVGDGVLQRKYSPAWSTTVILSGSANWPVILSAIIASSATLSHSL